jgi:hypothetical protein
MGTTKKDLVEDLWKKPHSFKRALILKLAAAGHYHDFDTKLAAPKMQLVADLRAAGFDDLAQKTIDGAYDDEYPNVEQQEELRRELGAEFYDEVMGAKGRGQA